MSDTDVRKKIKEKLQGYGCPDSYLDHEAESILSIVREAVNKEIQSLRENGKNTEYPHALSDIHDALMEVLS